MTSEQTVCEPTIEEAMIALVKRRIAGRTSAGDRVFLFDHVPQGVPRPYFTIEIIDDIPEQTTDGPVGLSKAMVAVTAWTEPSGGNSNAEEAIRLARVMGRRVDNQSGIFGGVYLSAVTRGAMTEMPSPAADGREYSLTGRQIEFEVWYQERNAQ